MDTGRGLLLESGTNAPLYRAPFASGRPRSSEENERHEARLAHALDINRAQRVLALDSFSTFPRCKKRVPGRQSIPKLTTTWNGTEWTNEAYPSREYLPTSFHKYQPPSFSGHSLNHKQIAWKACIPFPMNPSGNVSRLAPPPKSN